MIWKLWFQAIQIKSDLIWVTGLVNVLKVPLTHRAEGEKVASIPHRSKWSIKWDQCCRLQQLAQAFRIRCYLPRALFQGATLCQILEIFPNSYAYKWVGQTLDTICMEVHIWNSPLAHTLCGLLKQSNSCVDLTRCVPLYRTSARNRDETWCTYGHDENSYRKIIKRTKQRKYTPQAKGKKQTSKGNECPNQLQGVKESHRWWNKRFAVVVSFASRNCVAFVEGNKENSLPPEGYNTCGLPKLLVAARVKSSASHQWFLEKILHVTAGIFLSLTVRRSQILHLL